MNRNEIVRQVLELLSNAETALKLNEISKTLKLKSDSEEFFELKNILEELTSKGIIIKSSRQRFSMEISDSLSTARGILRYKHDRGLVECKIKFPVIISGKKVVVQEKEVKIVIKRKNLLTALDGDTVTVKLLAEKKGKKPRGEVIEIISRKDRIITGTIETDGSFNFLIPDEDIYYIDFLIPDKKLNGASHGDKVSAKFISWNDPQKSPLAEVKSIIGRSGKADTGFRTVMSEFSLPESFKSPVLQEANDIFRQFGSEKQMPSDGRMDFRKETIITIDPADAKDFDDALSLKMLENGNWQLGVHIADVSFYIKHNSETDKEAYRRGTSVYLVDRVVPMLPEIISNEICSLQPDKERLTFSVIMEINKLGTVKDYKISESIIKSKHRFSYDEVLGIIQQAKEGNKPRTKVNKLLIELHELASLLRKKRFEKGGVDFDTTEVKFELDENKVPVRAILKQNNEATSLVEECMLMANKTVASHIYKISKQFGLKETLPFLYRVHDVPDENKMKQTFRFIKLITKENPPNSLDSKQINNYLKKFKDKAQKPIVHQMIVRSMPKAEYSADNIGHYGLGFSKYAHFTSPIRRYPDLMVHRLLKEYNNAGTIQLEKMYKLRDTLERAGNHTTSQERMAMEAERASVKLAQTILASGMSGKIMGGTISGVTNFGIFVNLDDIYAEGLVHIKDLDDDYYIYDEQNFRLIGRVKKKIYRFGDKIEVQIVRANPEKRKIELKINKK